MNLKKITLEDIKSLPCFKCDKPVKLLYTEHWKEGDKPESQMWDGGIVDKISANYGSEHDSDMYIIAICDDCIKWHSEKLIYMGNYMFSPSKDSNI